MFSHSTNYLCLWDVYVRNGWKSIKRYSLVPSCTAVIAYSYTRMAHDVVNTEVFCICLYTKHERALTPSVSRDSLTLNMAATTNIT